MKKITLATFKSFIKKNSDNMLIRHNSGFSGMTDCVEQYPNTTFKKAEKTTEFLEHNLGFDGLWLVGYSRDYFQHFETETLIGIKLFNCCGSSTVAIEKQGV